MENNIIELLINIVGSENLITNKDDLENYSHDETEDLVFYPEVVLFPSTPQEISEIMKIAYHYSIPVTPRGAGTGLSGGALPVCKGIVLSMKKFNKIISIDTLNFQVITETGVITEELQNAVMKHGLYYPPDPASKGSCFIGGNLAESSGGPKAVKYGITRDYVLNMEVVLPTGEIIWTGANVLKNSTGYNLTQLMIGSEGTLGIITKVVLKLLTLPTHDRVLLVAFRSAKEACQAVNAILMAGIVPSALEFMEKDAIELTIAYLGIDKKIASDIEAHLLIEINGFDLDVLQKEAEKIYEVICNYDIEEPLFAESENEKQELWKLRRNVATAIRACSVYKEEDTVVPRGHLPEMLSFIKKLSKENGFRSICFGHAGDGNLHVFILKDKLTDYQWNTEIITPIRELFKETVRLGGTISGEHGIGWVQKKYLDIAICPVQQALMKGIKNVFDPKGLLNPKKIIN